MAKNARSAKRFARALLNAVPLDEFESVHGKLGMVAEMMRQNRDIHAVLTSPLFSVEERGRAVETIAGRLELSGNVRKFLLHVVSAGMAAILDEILAVAMSIYQERKKKASATVITPVAVSGELAERLRNALGRLTSRDVDITFSHDPSLLGGFIVKVGSTMYDSSLKGQLRLLKDELIKG